MNIWTWLRKLANTQKRKAEKERLREMIVELLREESASISLGQCISLLEKQIKDNRWQESKARDDKDFAKAKALNHNCFQLRERLASARNDESATRQRAASQLHAVLLHLVDETL